MTGAGLAVGAAADPLTPSPLFTMTHQRKCFMKYDASPIIDHGNGIGATL